MVSQTPTCIKLQNISSRIIHYTEIINEVHMYEQLINEGKGRLPNAISNNKRKIRRKKQNHHDSSAKENVQT